MTGSSQPTRLPADVYDSAVAATRVTSCTVPQQIARWTRTGGEVEMSPRVDHRAILRVLAGAGSYDSLDEHEQAVVREGWAGRATALRGALDYGAEFASAGESYSEADENGDLVVRPARS